MCKKWNIICESGASKHSFFITSYLATFSMKHEKLWWGRSSDCGKFRLVSSDSREGYGIVCWTMYNKNNFPCHPLILNHLSLFGEGRESTKSCVLKIQYFVYDKISVFANRYFCYRCWNEHVARRRMSCPKKKFRVSFSLRKGKKRLFAIFFWVK